jgi:ureidoacrylate peracid hydrolase
MNALSEFDLDPARTALLVIDFQNDFCHADGFFAGAGHDVSTCMAAAQRTAQLIEHVRPFGIPVLYSRSINPEQPTYKLPPLRFRAPRDSDAFERSVGGTNRFDPDSWGAQLVDELSPAAGERVIDKPRYNMFHRTSLEEDLRARGIDTIVITGATTNCCVESTSRDGFMRGFAVLVLTDCVAAFGNEWDLHEASLRNLSLFFAVLATSDEYVEDLKARLPEPAAV